VETVRGAQKVSAQNIINTKAEVIMRGSQGRGDICGIKEHCCSNFSLTC